MSVIFLSDLPTVAKTPTEASARKNFRIFLEDLEKILPGVEGTFGERYENLWNFDLKYKGQKCEGSIPGLPSQYVRFKKDFSEFDGILPAGCFPPRLYVEGNSWLWPFALDIAQSTLDPEPEEEPTAEEIATRVCATCNKDLSKGFYSQHLSLADPPPPDAFYCSPKCEPKQRMF